MQKDGFYDKEQEGYLEYKYRVNENMFYLTNDILLLRKKDTDSHCPILVTIEPSDMSNQEKKSFRLMKPGKTEQIREKRTKGEESKGQGEVRKLRYTAHPKR